MDHVPPVSSRLGAADRINPLVFLAADPESRRHASQTVHLWLTKLKDLPSSKRLNMIYLANGQTHWSS